MVLFCLASQAQTTVGPNSAGAGANSGTVAWVNPGNITTTNNAYATITNGVSGFLRASNFGFAIPVSSTITGVLVEIERRANPVNPVTSTGWVTRSMTDYTGSANAATTYGTINHSYTLPSPAGANRMLVAVIGIENTDQVTVTTQNPGVTITNVTYGGIAMTFGTTNYIASAPTGNRVAIYYLLESQLATLTAGTTYNLQVTKNFLGETGAETITPNEYVEMVGLNTYSNVNQTAPVDVSSNALAGSPAAITATAAFTNSRDGDVIVAATTNNGPGGSITQAATYTENFELVRNNIGGGGSVGAILEVQSKTLTAPAANETVSATATGATRLVICGIAIRAARVYDNSVMLMQGGVATGNNYAIPNTFPNAWPDTDTYISYGGLTDTWGVTWTPAQINAANFGLSLQADARNAIASVDHIRITVRYMVILATEVKSFEISIAKQQVQATLLFTTTDHDKYQFDFERSQNGNDFTAVQNLVVQGTKTDLQQVGFYDKNPLPNTSYYRVKITELQNGKVSFTALRAIDNEELQIENLLLFPNPCKEQLTLQVEQSAIEKVSVFDTKGQLLLLYDNTEENTQLLRLPIPAYLAQGVYVVQVVTAKQIIRKQLVIQ